MSDSKTLEILLAGLRSELRSARLPMAEAPLELMADKGLAHHHVRLLGTGQIARLPKQSQMGLAPQENIDYERACFERAGPSGHVPRLFNAIDASLALPRGGLLVEEIVGRDARLPDDLGAIARALASIHALPLPEPARRPPLLSSADPLASLRVEIDAQASYLDEAGLEPAARATIERIYKDFSHTCDQPARPGLKLISFDAHPGNFLLRADGRAVLVDLEKARYSYPPLDLAHATLYTSTTWDVATHAELDVAQVLETYRQWELHSGFGQSLRPWYLPLRAAMWLWSVTWCAKWRVLSPRGSAGNGGGEDWSHDLSTDALVDHVRNRVDCYLGAPIVQRVVDEFTELGRAWQG